MYTESNKMCNLNKVNAITVFIIVIYYPNLYLKIQVTKNVALVSLNHFIYPKLYLYSLNLINSTRPSFKVLFLLFKK